MSRASGAWPFCETGAIPPQLWPLEALNGLLTAARRGRIDRGARLRLAGFLQMPPLEIDGETASRSWTTTAHLADQHRLTTCDATYLELAMRRGVPLATSDTALSAAAGAVGIRLLPTS